MAPPMSVLGFQVHPNRCMDVSFGQLAAAEPKIWYFQTSTEPQGDTFGMLLQAVYNYINGRGTTRTLPETNGLRP